MFWEGFEVIHPREGARWRSWGSRTPDRERRLAGSRSAGLSFRADGDGTSAFSQSLMTSEFVLDG